jgi:ABC-type sugar transport system substrate-binding protein
VIGAAALGATSPLAQAAAKQHIVTVVKLMGVQWFDRMEQGVRKIIPK